MEKKTFETGAQRGSDNNDVNLSLIPIEAMEAYGRAFAEGEKKYGRDNWLKGFPVTNLITHALIHLYRFLAGDKSEDHLGHALWNIGAACYFMQHRPELDDRPKYAEHLPKPKVYTHPPKFEVGDRVEWLDEYLNSTLQGTIKVRRFIESLSLYGYTITMDSGELRRYTEDVLTLFEPKPKTCTPLPRFKAGDKVEWDDDTEGLLAEGTVVKYQDNQKDLSRWYTIKFASGIHTSIKEKFLRLCTPKPKQPTHGRSHSDLFDVGDLVKVPVYDGRVGKVHSKFTNPVVGWIYQVSLFDNSTGAFYLHPYIGSQLRKADSETTT